jgi:hypothetical protein
MVSFVLRVVQEELDQVSRQTGAGIEPSFQLVSHLDSERLGLLLNSLIASFSGRSFSSWSALIVAPRSPPIFFGRTSWIERCGVNG